MQELCKICGNGTSPKGVKTPLLAGTPLFQKLPAAFCRRCDLVQPSMATQRLIKNSRQWLDREHFGTHYIKKLPKKDHYACHKAYSTSMLGEAPKTVVRAPNTGELYLFKEPKRHHEIVSHGFRETVTELILSNLASMVTVAASCSICSYKGKVVLSSKIFTTPSDRLVHGVEIFKKLYDDGGIEEIQEDREKQRTFYTLQHIEEALGEFLPTLGQAILNDLHMMVLADAWVGNQDRHAENWGLLERRSSASAPPEYSFAPVFDTARGLFWNTNLVGLKDLYTGRDGEKNIEKYIDSCLPLIGLNQSIRPNHFDVARSIFLGKGRTLFMKFLNAIRSIDLDLQLDQYRGMIAPLRLHLIRRVLEKRREKLCKIPLE